MRDLIIRAVEREIGIPAEDARTGRVKLPLVRLSSGRKVDLTGFDFDDLLA